MTILDSLKKWGSKWNIVQNGDNVADEINNIVENLPFGINIEMVELIGEVTTVPDENVCWTININEPFKINLCEGRTYTVNFDGVKYNCIAKLDESGYVYIGDYYLWSGEESDERFPFIYGDGWFGTYEPGTYTVSISGPNLVGITKISPDYLPTPVIVNMDDYVSILTDTPWSRIYDINEGDSFEVEPGKWNLFAKIFTHATMGYFFSNTNLVPCSVYVNGTDLITIESQYNEVSPVEGGKYCMWVYVSRIDFEYNYDTKTMTCVGFRYNKYKSDAVFSKVD